MAKSSKKYDYFDKFNFPKKFNEVDLDLIDRYISDFESLWESYFKENVEQNCRDMREDRIEAIGDNPEIFLKIKLDFFNRSQMKKVYLPLPDIEVDLNWLLNNIHLIDFIENNSKIELKFNEEPIVYFRVNGVIHVMKRFI